MEVYSTVSDGAYQTVNFDKINKCDLFVLGGGELIRRDCLGQPTPNRFKFKNHSLPYKLYNKTFFAHLPWVKHVKIPKAILGCGVDATQLESNVIKDLAEFDYIGLRDHTSVALLSNLPKLTGKVHLFYDLAFQNKISNTTKNGQYAVIIPTGNLDTVHNSEGWLRRELAGFSNVWFIPFGQIDNDDYYTARTLSPCNTSKNGSYFLMPNEVNLNKVLSLMSLCKVVFTYRLHGLILAFMLGKPCKFYPYHGKLTRVSQTLQGFSVEEIREVQAAEFKRLMECCGFNSLTAKRTTLSHLKTSEIERTQR